MTVQNAPLLEVENVARVFGGGRALFGGRPGVHALRGVSLTVDKGESLGVVGESGCGKTTLARLVAGLEKPTTGRVVFDGRDISSLTPRERARKIQYVFQNPVSALNPRQTARAALEAPLRCLLKMDKAARAAKTKQLMEAVGLPAAFLERYPHEFSGGQAQRIGVARALAAQPELIVLDEPVSALDVSVQGQVLNLLAELKKQFALTYLFISHDLAVVESVSDRVAVMYFGRVAEHGGARDIFLRPRHPYTRLLLESAPAIGKPLPQPGGDGDLPDPCAPPPGCAFFARCPRGDRQCQNAQPELIAADEDAAHVAACFHPYNCNGDG